MSRPIKCFYCPRAPTFENVDRKLVCDLHHAEGVTRATPRQQEEQTQDIPDADGNTTPCPVGLDALILAARAAVDDMAFVLHEDVRVHD